jgi:hypothetical protein
MAERNRTPGSSDWQNEERFWRENYHTRPYVQEGRDFEEYRPGYQYGYESANRLTGRSWTDSERDLREGWESYDAGSHDKSAWESIKETVRDAWDRVRGEDDEHRHRT